MLIRIGLLLSIAWMMQLTTPLFSIAWWGRTFPVVTSFSSAVACSSSPRAPMKFMSISRVTSAMERRGSRRRSVRCIVQILLLDIVFSLDSVITAVGMAEDVAVMVLAVVIAVGVMLLSSRSIGEFVERHPTVKMLALSFLLLIGMSLMLEGFGQHIRKGYIYFAMGFSVFVEMINLRVRVARPSGAAAPEVHG